MDYGARIRKRRKELRLSVQDLAEKIGKNRGTVYRYENGEIDKLPLDVIEPLAVALQTSTAYILGITDNPSSFTTNTPMSLVGKLEQRQNALGLTDAQLSDRSGISIVVLESIKNGESSELTYDRVVALSKALNVSASYFYVAPSMVEDLSANIQALMDINQIDGFSFEEAVGADIENPSSVDLELIADFFGVDFEDLLYKDYVSMKKNSYCRARVRALRMVKTFFEDLEREWE